MRQNDAKGYAEARKGWLSSGFLCESLCVLCGLINFRPLISDF